ncbi:MAG: hypothetical protein ACFFCS_21955 [Candidatus Hodarchaeota archaeon]
MSNVKQFNQVASTMVLHSIIAADPPPGNMTHVDVTLRLSVDLDRFKFPVDKRGEMLYNPLHCLDEAIMDGLFKNLDPSSMDYIDPDRAIGIEGWVTRHRDEFKRTLGMDCEKKKSGPGKPGNNS